MDKALFPAMPTAPALALRAKPLRVLSLRASIGIAVAACLAGCAPAAEEPLSWLDAPSDPQVRNYVFEQCLRLSKGPAKTVYNDWDEAIGACSRTAANQSTYCPEDRECRSDIASRADVRSMLPAQETSVRMDQDPQGLEAKPAGSVSAGNAPENKEFHP